MKQRFLFLLSLILFTTCQLQAQITLTSADYLQIGDVILQATDSSATVTPGPAGTNQVWDFSSLTSNDTTRVEGVDPGTTPLADSFPTANLATLIELEGDTAYTFLNITSERIQLLGLGVSLLIEEMPGAMPANEVIRYNTPRTQAELPVTFGSTFTSDSELEYTVEDEDGAITIKQTSTHISTIDGWGNAILPDNVTYPVLREQVITNRTDSLAIEVPGEQPFVLVTESIDTSYNFLSPTAKGVLASFTPTIDPFTNETDGFEISYYVGTQAPAGDAPVANFVYTAEGTTGNVEFTDLSANTPTSWSWDFGDGNVSTDQNPTHTYAASGTFDVCLTVANEFGSDSTCNAVAVLVGDAPVAAFTADPAADGSGQVTFTDQSTDPLNWQWDFGDGSPVSNEQSPVHTYDSTGTYDVCLVVTNEFGIDTVCQAVAVVVGQAPVADFTASIAGETGEVVFTDASTNTPTSWDWAFGDGNVSTDQNPTHTYAASGTYTVQLIAGNDFGSDTTSQMITVTVGQAPVADFTISIQGETGEVVFTDASTNAPTSWDWAFGDGNVSTDQNPTHAYAASGTYTVQLIAGNDFGTDTASQEVTVVVTSINDLPNGSQLLIAPNPFGAQLNLQLTNWTQQAAELLIYDAAGRLQHRTTLRDQVQINTAQWARGIYHYQLRTNDGILRSGQLIRQ